MPRGKHKNHCIDCNRLFDERDLYYDHKCKKCHRRFNDEIDRSDRHIRRVNSYYGRQGKTKTNRKS